MSDNAGSDGGETPKHSPLRGRRQLLTYLTAGAFGGMAALGLNRVFTGRERTAGDATEPRGTDSRENALGTYDVSVYEGSTEYRATDSSGGTIDSGSDGWTVLKNSIDAVPDGGSIRVNGRYRGASTIEVGKSIHLNGRDASIQFEQPGSFAFYFEGDNRLKTSLTESASTGSQQLRLDDTSGVQKGDLVLLLDEEGDPVLGRDKPPGESHSVLEVDGDSVRLADSIVWRGGYPSGTSAYVFDPIQVHVSGFDVSAPAKDEDFRGVRAEKCRDSTFENLWLDKFGNRGILLQACANVRVRDCPVLQSADIEAADGYGIHVWAGCHGILVEGCTAKECRHPLSVTGGGGLPVASRAITFRDCFVTANGAGALNCHGGSAHDVRFENCRVHTWGDPGVTTGAQKTTVSGCEFRMDGHNAISTRGDGQEMTITVTDTDIYNAENAIKLNREADWNYFPLWKLVHLDGVRASQCGRFFTLGDSSKIERLRHLQMNNCYWDEVDKAGLRLSNRLDSGLIEGNYFGAAPNSPHILIRDDGDTNVRNLQITGNQLQQPRGTTAFIRVSHSEQCIVSNNTFEAASDVDIYVDDVGSAANLIKENTYYAPNPPADPVDEADSSVARDNQVYDTAADEWV